MKIHIIILLIFGLFLTACSSSETANSGAASANAPTTANEVNSTAPTTTANSAASKPLVTIESLPPQHQPSTVSPTATMKALNEAARAKNFDAVKLVVSKKTLAEMEKNARENGMTVEELLANDDTAQFEEIPELRNEKITGDRATVEIKNALSGQWSTLPFVKENGVWKLAMTEYVEEVRKKMTEQMNESPVKESNKAVKK